MKIIIENLLDNLLVENEISIYKRKKNEIAYELSKEEYIWTLTNDKIVLEKKGEISYKNIFKYRKVTKSIIKIDGYEMLMYILTKDIKIDEKKVFLLYDIYSEDALNNLISSYKVEILF